MGRSGPGKPGPCVKCDADKAFYGGQWQCRDCIQRYYETVVRPRNAAKRFGGRLPGVSARPLLGKTCPACGAFLQAAAYGRRQDQQWFSKCRECRITELESNDGYRRNARATQRQTRNAQQSSSVDAATKRRQWWTGPELEVLEREDLTVKEMAAMLGRTLEACNTMRYKLRIDPRKRYLAGVRR